MNEQAPLHALDEIPLQNGQAEERSLLHPETHMLFRPDNSSGAMTGSFYWIDLRPDNGCIVVTYAHQDRNRQPNTPAYASLRYGATGELEWLRFGPKFDSETAGNSPQPQYPALFETMPERQKLYRTLECSTAEGDLVKFPYLIDVSDTYASLYLQHPGSKRIKQIRAARQAPIARISETMQNRNGIHEVPDILDVSTSIYNATYTLEQFVQKDSGADLLIAEQTLPALTEDILIAIQPARPMIDAARMIPETLFSSDIVIKQTAH